MPSIAEGAREVYKREVVRMYHDMAQGQGQNRDRLGKFGDKYGIQAALRDILATQAHGKELLNRPAKIGVIKDIDGRLLVPVSTQDEQGKTQHLEIQVDPGDSWYEVLAKYAKMGAPLENAPIAGSGNLSRDSIADEALRVYKAEVLRMYRNL